MARFVRWYGSGPLHLLVLIASFALTGYAMARLFAVQPLTVAIWFVGAAILRDLTLLPLYSLADLSALSTLRHRSADGPTVPWINHRRVPAFLSGLLLLVWFPLVFRMAARYSGDTGLSDTVHPGRWLAITGVLFAASAVTFAFRLRRARRAGRGDESRPATDHGAAP
jgi:hypothetical protein